MKELFDTVSEKCSILTTKSYSTSFSIGILLLSKEIRIPIYAIYGFVRFADEIVDTFHDFDKATLLEEFKNETYGAIERRISLNPILNSFQKAVNDYQIDRQLIETFLQSMKMDLEKREYDQDTISSYILGSAEVVGLMCLKVFCQGNEAQYQELKGSAMKLGSAFQKINFLRDVKYDNEALGRTYFPGVDFSNFSARQKTQIEEDIHIDLDIALEGIRQLPKNARLGVYVAFVYYLNLFRKIRRFTPQKVLSERVRVANWEKMRLLCTSYFYHNLNIL